MKKELSKLTWIDRFAIIDAFKPTEEVVCKVFNVSPHEYASAKEVRESGHLKKTSTIKPEHFKEHFAMSTEVQSESVEVITDATATAATPAVISTAAIDGSKAKTGPKTSKIFTAFSNIPTTPTPAEQFATQYGVSLAVLRQHKRFDTTGIGGKVNVRKDKASKTLMVWRGDENA